MVGTTGIVTIVILVLAAVVAVCWVFYSHWRAKQLGLPPPSLSFNPFRSNPDNSYGSAPRASGGITGWFGDQVTKFKTRNNRTAAGAYEGTAPSGASRGGGNNTTTRGGFGALDPDAAWDARVGDEAGYGPAGYDEEEGHEMGMGPYGRNSTAYEGANGTRGGHLGGSSALGVNGGHHGEHDSYAMNLAATPRMAPDEIDSRGRAGRNPFDDDAAEPSNLDLRGVSPRPMEGDYHGKRGDSPSGRRSIFTEQV